jgi:hypothetical protein
MSGSFSMALELEADLGGDRDVLASGALKKGAG